MNSMGGDVEAAMAIGRKIREYWLSTSIGTYAIDLSASTSAVRSRKLMPGSCMSAATLMFLGGRLRYLPEGSQFGVHRFSFRNPAPENVGHSQVLSAKIARYIADMGIDAGFLEVSSSTGSNEIRKLEEGELKSLQVITGGMTSVKWSVQAYSNSIYVRGERDSLFGHHKIMLGYAKNEGFFFFAVVEAQGREWELMNFSLVELVVNDEEIRIDVSDRCGRSVSGIYANIHASLTEIEAGMIAYSSGFGVQVRASQDAPVFLGISEMKTEGGKEQLETMYRLFSGLGSNKSS